MAAEKNKNSSDFGTIRINGKLYFLNQLCIDWFLMTNDDFFEKYGFSFNPHKYSGLYEWGRKEIYNITK